VPDDTVCVPENVRVALFEDRPDQVLTALNVPFVFLRSRVNVAVILVVPENPITLPLHDAVPDEICSDADALNVFVHNGIMPTGAAACAVIGTTLNISRTATRIPSPLFWIRIRITSFRQLLWPLLYITTEKDDSYTKYESR
jgi:hypothetical protein